MARLGRISKVSAGLYRDLDTGRFLSSRQAAPVLAQARRFGRLGGLTVRTANRMKRFLGDRFGLAGKELDETAIRAGREIVRMWEEEEEVEITEVLRRVGLL